MVRLKAANICHPIKAVARFQFHMVRLKAFYGRDYVGGFFIFQFHMVRLKGRLPLRGVSRHEISIPHGTIKRHRGQVSATLCHISIPHGTIKRQIG